MKVLERKTLCAVHGGALPLAAFVWGATLGVVGYTVSNKNHFYGSGFLLAGIGGGITALLDPYGAVGKCLQVLNVGVFAEVISSIQEESAII